jgi:HEAT repeat protein
MDPLRKLCSVIALSLLSYAQEAEPPAPAIAPWSWPTTSAHLVVGRCLREVRKAGPTATPRLVQTMLEAGGEVPAAMVDILTRQRVPEADEGDRPQVLSEPQREVLLTALAKAPRDRVGEALKERLEASPEDDRVGLGAVYVLGVIGTASDLVRIVDLAPRKSNGSESLTGAARDAVCAACTSILRRDPRAWPKINDLAQHCDERCARSMLEGLSRTKDPRVLGVLFEVAKKRETLASVCVPLAAQCGPSPDPAMEREFLAWMESELRAAAPSYARALLQTLGARDDGEHAQAMVDRLQAKDESVRKAAHWALQKISGLGLPADPVPWNAWLHEELAWHQRVRPRLNQDLASKDSERIVLALRSYAERRTRRGELAVEVAPVLENQRPELRRIACDVLGRLGSSTANAKLLAALGDPDPGVAEAARRALAAISGLDVPRDPAQARGVIQGT